MRVIANFKENLIRDLLLQGVPQKKIAAQVHTSCRVVSRIAAHLKSLEDHASQPGIPDVIMDPEVDQENQENHDPGMEIPEPFSIIEYTGLDHIFTAFQKQMKTKGKDWYLISAALYERLSEVLKFLAYVTRNGRKKYFD